jgi:hypothetical protein
MHTALTVFFPAQGDLKHFSFQPLRNVGWNETAIFYKLTVSRPQSSMDKTLLTTRPIPFQPLLSDDKGSVAVRISPETMEKIVSAMQADDVS